MTDNPAQSPEALRIVALSGGVGGARLAHGLAHCTPPHDLTVIVNTADDFRPYGLHVAPDVDTVLYTLAGLVSETTGWGRAADTGNVMAELAKLGDDPWFFLGDRDLALHLIRSRGLSSGLPLSAVTADLRQRLAVAPQVVPMTDDHVRTIIATDDGDLPLQEWFVARQCAPPARGLRYDGAGSAVPTPAALEAVAAAQLLIIGPSNPYLSIGPILALDGYLEALGASPAPIVAVSPLIGGQAVKGPAAQMLRDLAGEASSATIASLYADLLSGLVIDSADAGDVDRIHRLGIQTLVTGTLMSGPEERRRLAQELVDFGRTLAKP